MFYLSNVRAKTRTLQFADLVAGLKLRHFKTKADSLRE
jgi:hypothetical protein